MPWRYGPAVTAEDTPAGRFRRLPASTVEAGRGTGESATLLGMAADVVVRKFNPTLSERRCTDAPTCTVPKRWTLARYTQVTREGVTEHSDHEPYWFSTGCDEHRDSQLADLASRVGRRLEVEYP